MARFLLTNKAVEDLSDIWDYTFNKWSERQADKYYDLLVNSMQHVCTNPELGKPYRELDENILGFRVGTHIVFYRQIDFDEIEIVRILHQTMDLKSRMNE
ncbi:MAG: type II toxin-antitoxin system RelE/ParE family toxin [Chitinophagaceae bacterium]|nr:MAG: type II toxin-antitoxin system RelE/ParE family toxin [Chitinophagaceae bacterium]